MLSEARYIEYFLVSLFALCLPSEGRAQDIEPSPTTVSTADTSTVLPDPPTEKNEPSELPDAPGMGTDESGVAHPPKNMVLAFSAAPTFTPGRDAFQWHASIGPKFEPPKVTLQQCPYDETHARSCRVHWGQLTISTALFLTFLNAGNLYTGYWYRYEMTHGAQISPESDIRNNDDWWQRYVNSVAGWRWNKWSDNNPFLDDWVGHPMMGAITDFLWIQNDPKGMTLAFSNTKPYWVSRLRALAYSTVVHFEWKFGPLGEASIGHNGDHYFYDKGTLTNETGWVELVSTPVGGFAWTVTEDVLDKYVITRLEEKSRNPFLLFTYQFLNPSRGAANILRFRPPWYRDSRNVTSSSRWHDPEPQEPLLFLPAEKRGETANASDETEEGIPGGKHELGAWWGLSLMSGHLWGITGDVKYMPMVVTYSGLIALNRNWEIRYAPELTALAMIDYQLEGATDRFALRRRTYGSGISPEGFRVNFRPTKRFQPYLSNNGGGIYFWNHVLSPHGSNFMFTLDAGCGFQVFRKLHQSVSVGYRYQHLWSASTNLNKPGTDTNTFYVAVSRFR